MVRPKVFMYSGQGSQYFHMTRELYDCNQRYRTWLDHCLDIADDLLGTSLLDIVFNPKASRGDPFDSLAESNAALVCVEYSLTQVVRELGHEPDLLLGYSLGEITAATVSGAVSLEDGLTIAVGLGRLIENHTPRAGMLAVVAPTMLARTRAELFEGVQIIGTNFHGNFVVSGLASDVDSVQRRLEEATVPCQRLPVNWGVHTPLIDPIRDEALRLLSKAALSSPSVPVISSVTTDRMPMTSTHHFWDAVRDPVDFARTVQKVLAKGDSIFIDLGPSATLATFVKYSLPTGSGSLQVSTVNRFGKDAKSLTEFRTQMADA